MTGINPGAHFQELIHRRCAFFSGFHNTVMHIVDALAQRSCIFYDRHKSVVHMFEALTVGSNAHKAK